MPVRIARRRCFGVMWPGTPASDVNALINYAPAAPRPDGDGARRDGDVGQRSGRRSAPSEEVEDVNEVGEEGSDLALRHDETDADLRRDRGDRDGDPDVLLDVPELRVDEISLEVEDLRARVALQADVLSLLKLHVGVEAELGRVQLTIKGVEAQALLKVRLDNVARIIDRVLTTIDNNPEIVEGLIEQVGEAAQEVGGGARQAVGDLAPAAGSAVEEAGEAAGTAVGGGGRAAEQVSKGVAEGAEQVTDDVAEEPRPKRPRSGKPRRSTERGAERRPRRSKAESPADKRPKKRTRPGSDRRPNEE